MAGRSARLSVRNSLQSRGGQEFGRTSMSGSTLLNTIGQLLKMCASRLHSRKKTKTSNLCLSTAVVSTTNNDCGIDVATVCFEKGQDEPRKDWYSSACGGLPNGLNGCARAFVTHVRMSLACDLPSLSTPASGLLQRNVTPMSGNVLQVPVGSWYADKK